MYTYCAYTIISAIYIYSYKYIQHLIPIYVIILTITYIIYHRHNGSILLQRNMVQPFLFASGDSVVGVGKVLEVPFVSSILFHTCWSMLKSGKIQVFYMPFH